MWLNITWFVLYVVIIGGYVILDGFDLGVGMLSPFVAKDDTEQRILLNSIGPVWDGNEVWLVLGGGALFAAFPLVYASLFSRLLPGHDAGAAGAHPAHGRHRVPLQAGERSLASDLGLVLLRLLARHHRAARGRPRQRRSEAWRSTRPATWTSA